jgi:AcrR family transcriptional regulator
MSTTTRQLILQRCFEAIQAKGFETLRTDKEIARLKITKGAFYHYFPNKSELGYAVVDEVINQHKELVKSMPKPEPTDTQKNVRVFGRILGFGSLFDSLGKR